MLVTLVGDIHQKRAHFNAEYLPPNSIQLGDVGFDYSQWGKNNRKLSNPKPGKRFFIDGNHDHHLEFEQGTQPQEIQPDLWHVPRGFVSGRVMFIGGADSIDSHLRVPGYDWWPEEKLSMMEVDCILETQARVDTIIAHDLPAFAYSGVGVSNIIGLHCRDLEVIFHRFKPKRWFCGHHHQSKRFTVENCDFRVLDIAERLEVELELGRGFFD